MYRLAFRTDNGFKLGIKTYVTLEEAKERFLILKEDFNKRGLVIVLDTIEEIKVVCE